MSSMDEQGLEDAAILLMSLGEEQAAEIFKHLDPKEVQHLGETMARLKTVSRERVQNVLTRFSTDVADTSSLVEDTDAYVKSVLRKALGDDKAKLLIDRILQGNDMSGIESLKWMEPAAVAELLHDEHPQIIATILVHLGTEQAAGVLQQLEEARRNEVTVRIATLDSVQPVALRDLNEVMSKVFSGSEKLCKSTLGGIKPAADLINMLGNGADTAVLDYIAEVDSELAQQIMESMFVFEDVGKIDDRGIQALLTEVSTDSLVVALKGADPELRDKILRNMSSRAADALREELELRGPMRLSEVEAEQKIILQTVRRLSEEGTIVLGGGGDDAFV